MTQYTVTAALGGGWIALYNGFECATSDTLEGVALMCADDAIDAYPECAPDVVYDVAAETGQMVGNVKHMSWFRHAVAEAIMDEWPETV
jgi:hypothetical protein